MERPSPSPRTAGVAEARRSRAGRAGFTLIELVVVVVIISVFAALAIPNVTRQLRDRRVHETAQRVALAYQQGRMRAMGQGGAVLVRYVQGTRGVLETREALVGPSVGTCAIHPAASCTQTDWDVAANGEYRTIERVDYATEPGLDNVFVRANTAPTATDAAAATNEMDVCFTPLGRTFVRYSTAPGTPFVPLTGVPVLEVYRGANASTPVGLTRRVLVLPSGIARLQL